MNEQNLVWGLHPVRETLARAPERVLELWVLGGRADERMEAVLELARAQGIACQAVRRDTLDGMAQGGTHQGVVARLAAAAPLDEDDLEALLDRLQAPPLLLVLDGVQDPHNLGACLRSADAAGAAAVIVPRDRAAGLTPVVRKVAAGAAETVPLVAVVNLARTLRGLQERGVWLVGTDDTAERTLYDADLAGPVAVVMGSEGEGLRRLTRDSCDQLVSIPMAGAVESLNVSVATGIVLFEAVRQRSAKKK